MKTVTISRKELTGDLVVLPRKDYEQLLVLANARAELEQGLAISLAEVEQKKVSDRFETAADLMTSLNR